MTQSISIQSVVNFLKQHPVTVGITFSSISAAFIYYYSVISKKQKLKKQNNRNNKGSPNNHAKKQEQKFYQNQQQQIARQLNKLRQTRQKLQKCSSQFKVQYLVEENCDAILTQQCLLNIFDKCVELVDQEELNRIYQTSRRARRTIFSKTLINTQIRQSNRRDSLQSVKSQEKLLQYNPANPPLNTQRHHEPTLKQKLESSAPLTYPQALSFSQMYYRFVCTFQEEFKYLIQKTQKDFAAFLDVDFQTITQSIEFHISKEESQSFKQKIQQWTSSIRQMLKNKLVKYSETIDPEKIREILAYQISYLKQKRSKLLQTIHKLGISNQQQLDALPTLLATILQDIVFEKFKIENQQMTVDMMHLSKNKELQFLVEQFQKLTEDIVGEMYQQVNKDQIFNDSSDYF